MEKTFKKVIDGNAMIINHNLEDFTIYKRSSSFIDYIAVKDDKLFIQFSTGNCVVYDGVPMDVQKAAIAAPSIGKYYHTVIKDKFENTKVQNYCIALDTSATDYDDDDDDTFDDDDKDLVPYDEDI